VPFTEILDVVKDTGFTGIRLNSFPGALTKYNITVADLERELNKRNLRLVTVSFGGQADDPAKHDAIEKDAREAMSFLKGFGATDLVVFAPSKTNKILVPERLRVACEFYNRLGEVAAEYGFRAGLHNHLDQIVETQDEIELFLKWTDPKRFHFAPDTAHAYLAGCDVLELFEKHASRISFIDYKDARLTPARQDIKLQNGRVLQAGTALATFFGSIYDLGDGEIDFRPLHRFLKRVRFKGWICPDLDYVRVSPRESFRRSMKYIREKLEPVYA
jgi:sugar phosphate isomerase/epimerase